MTERMFTIDEVSQAVKQGRVRKCIKLVVRGCVCVRSLYLV